MLTLAMPRDAHPACEDPKHLPLVEATFKAQGRDAGAKAAKALFNAACAHCPVPDQCLAIGMNGEHGAWAGTTERQRTTHGGRRVAHAANVRGVEHGIRRGA